MNLGRVHSLVMLPDIYVLLTLPNTTTYHFQANLLNSSSQSLRHFFHFDEPILCRLLG